LLKYLIIEDCPNKLENIKTFLFSLNISNSRIKNIDNKSDALILLKERTFDFLILDINIHLSSDKKGPVAGAGVELLTELDDSVNSSRVNYNIPPTTFILSEFPDVIAENLSQIHSCKVFPCEYNDNSDDWKHELEHEIKKAIAKENSYLPMSTDEIVVYSVHGILTFGDWQKELDQLFTKYGTKKVRHVVYKYDLYPLRHFLRTKKRYLEVEKLKNELFTYAERNPEAKICLVGHSFGTYIIAEALRTMSESINIDKIILSGSVLKPDYNWGEIIKKHKINSITNECASRDFALICAHYIAKGLGLGGFVGFGNRGGVVTNRYFDGGHSTFFTKKTLKEWVQHLHGKKLIFKDERGCPTLVDNIISLLIKTRRRTVALFTSIILITIPLVYVLSM
jgi:hypothetical protein